MDTLLEMESTGVSVTRQDWQGKRVVIIGAARQGLALARFLSTHGAVVTLTDRRPAEELGEAQKKLADLANVTWVAGGHPYSLLDGADLVCLSGGVSPDLPLAVEAHRRGIALSNDSQIFLEAAPCQVIGITGSAGKTTTTSLVGRIARAALESSARGRMVQTGKVWVGGNIGAPLIASVDAMGAQDLAVMELSSFQLEIMSRSPQIAAILNITPNHLDRHGSMLAYTAAKARILDFQSGSEAAVLGRDDPGAWALAGRVKGQLYSFGLSDLPEGEAGSFLRGEQIFVQQPDQESIPVLKLNEIELRGEHNLLNVLAAAAITAASRLPLSAVRSGVRGFRGVAHRLEFVRSWGGADWYNDSIATAPERAMAAIRSFEGPLVLLAGGRDKDLPWEDFAALVKWRVDHLIVFGEAAGKILDVLSTTPDPERSQPLTIDRAAGLKDAIRVAARIVEPGDVVLLSPGGTSFDEFRDFEERGQCFVQLVNSLS